MTDDKTSPADSSDSSPPAGACAEAAREALLTLARALPDGPGVYIMKDEAEVEIYIGKAKSLKKRVASYFQRKDRLGKEAALLGNVFAFDIIETESEVEALLLESRLIKDLQPKYNFMLKNNELYPFIEVTLGEDFPRLKSSRQQTDAKSRYFGPFVSAGDVNITIALLQRIFQVRTSHHRIIADDKKLVRKRPCLNWHIGRCSAPCNGSIQKQEYRKRIHSVCRFLAGQKKDLLRDLEKEMHAAAARMQFEVAAELRNMTQALANINTQPAIDASLMPMVMPIDPAKGLIALQEALALSTTPKTIEGIDIANLQGKEVVGSLVRFVDGLPVKGGYRRFRIKTVKGQDDFACIAEVVRRRYGRMLREGDALPDIILIDGGLGQLRWAADALREIGARPGVLISLAKREETIYREDQKEPICLSKRNTGLRLLMAVRDESHRFAQHYHHILRKKAVFGA